MTTAPKAVLRTVRTQPDDDYRQFLEQVRDDGLLGLAQAIDELVQEVDPARS